MRSTTLAAGVLVLGSLAQAQGRDPTVPPAEVGRPATGAPEMPAAGLVLEPGSITVLQRGGVYHLVLGTRTYAPGQTVRDSKIERITETEVWLTENGNVRKVAIFAGLSRRAVPPEAVVTPAPYEPRSLHHE